MRDRALREVKNRQKTEDSLSKLTSELKNRNWHLTMLYEMNQEIQLRDSLPEVRSVILDYAQTLFPDFHCELILSDWLATDLMIEKSDLNAKNKKGAFALKDGICCPLNAKGKNIGKICWHGKESFQMSENDRILAINFSEQIALNIANLMMRNTLYNLSIKDSLTGLYNRRYLEEFLERELIRCQIKQLPLGVIMFDLDYFKRINDTFGHEAGDIVLKAISNLLKENTRQPDLCCRYGGEEFIAILPEQDWKKTIQVAERLRELIQLLKIDHKGESLGKVTASFGLAIYPQNGITVSSLFYHADMALYLSKQNGRNQVNYLDT